MEIDPHADFGTRECPGCATEVPANENRSPICGYEFPGRGIVDAAREDEMVAARASAGCSLGLPEDWTSDLFKTVLKGCVAISHERLGAVAE